MNTTSPILPRWLTPSQLARRWGVHPETVLRLIRAGRLPAEWVNARVIRITELDAASYIATQAAKKAQLAQLATNPADVALTGQLRPQFSKHGNPLPKNLQ